MRITYALLFIVLYAGVAHAQDPPPVYGPTTFSQLGVGRGPSSQTQMHVSRSTLFPGNNRTIQADIYAEGGKGGAWTGIVANALAGPDWDSNNGYLFAFAGEATLRSPGNGVAWGANFQAKCMFGADGCQITGTEFNVISEAQPSFRGGLIIAAVPSSERPTHQGQQATGFDAMIVFAAKNYAAPFKDGLLFANVDGTQFPIAANGSIMRIKPEWPGTPIGSGIDFSHPNAHFIGPWIQGPGFRVTGAGVVEIGTDETGRVILIVGMDKGKRCLMANFGNGPSKPVVCE